MRRLTEQAHDMISGCVLRGESVVDATAGNGHDTLFLSRLVGCDGSVLAIDIQAEAIRSISRILEGPAAGPVTVVQADHANLDALVTDWKGPQTCLAAVMFNLGYRPGGDHGIATTAAGTLPALSAALKRLRPGGIVSLIVYRGHEEGAREAASVMQFLETLARRQFMIQEIRSASDAGTAPILFTIRKAPDLRVHVRTK